MAHLAREQEIGGYEAEAEAADALASFYTGFAGLLGADPSEIAYVENATRAWDMAFYGLPLVDGDRILTHGSEYASNYLALLQQAGRRGLHVDLVPSDGSGQIDVEALEKMIMPRTRLIALTHVPTQGGLVNPAEAVGRVAQTHGLLYMLDACQSVGQMPVNVEAIGCHILSGTGRKFLRGPRGTGFLVCRELDTQHHRTTLHRPARGHVDRGGQLRTGPRRRRFENLESYVAGRVGLAKAVEYASDIGIKGIEERVTALADDLRTRLADTPGVSVHDQGERRCGIVTFRVTDEPPSDTAARLAAAGINVSVSVRRYAQLDLGARGLDAVTRASVHYYNTEDEVSRFVEVVAGG